MVDTLAFHVPLHYKKVCLWLVIFHSQILWDYILFKISCSRSHQHYIEKNIFENKPKLKLYDLFLSLNYLILAPDFRSQHFVSQRFFSPDFCYKGFFPPVDFCSSDFCFPNFCYPNFCSPNFWSPNFCSPNFDSPDFWSREDFSFPKYFIQQYFFLQPNFVLQRFFLRFLLTILCSFLCIQKKKIRGNPFSFSNLLCYLKKNIVCTPL